MTTTTVFRNKQRDQLGDIIQGSQTFTDQQLDGWRDDETSLLYSRGIFKKDTNYGTEVPIGSTGTLTDITFATNGSAKDTIGRAAGSFVTDGFLAGKTITVSGATNTGNNVVFTLYSVSALVLTLVAANAVTAESSGASVVITTDVPQYFLIPSLFRRIYRTEIISSSDLNTVYANSYGFDDLERPGYIRVPEASGYGGYVLRFFGEKEYSGVTDTSMKQEVQDVILFGSCLRALLGEYAKRIEARRSLATTRKADTTPTDILGGVGMLERRLQRSVALAVAIQARSIYGGV